MIRWLTILFVLLIVGCDYAPTEHTHISVSEGVCVEDWEFTMYNGYAIGCFEVTEAYCYEEGNGDWLTPYTSCSEYCDGWCESQSDFFELSNYDCNRVGEDEHPTHTSMGCYALPESLYY